MKKTVKQICLRAASCVLAGCMLLCPIEGKAAQKGAEKEETVLFEEGFETGNAGMWSSRAGAKLSVVSEHPKSGSYCMKISGRTAPASGAAIKAGQMLQTNQRLAISANARYNEGPEQKRVQITMFCDENYYVLGSSELTRGEWGELTGSIILSDNMNLEDAELFFETPWTPEPSAEQDLMDLYLDDIKATLRPFCDISEYPSLKELYRSQFLVGTAVSEPTLRTSVYSNLLRQQFNSITMENEMKPAYALDEAASKSDLEQHQEHAALNFNSFRAGLEYARQHGIAVRGHTLVWHSQTPEWFFYKNYDTSGELADRELMLKRMENYIKEVIAWTETNYPGVIYAWDVVNEAAADPWGENADYLLRQEGSLWYQTIGDDFVQKAFAYARAYTTEYAPDHKIKLFYNDYNEYFSVKRDRIVDILKPVKEAGNIDGMGMQSHFDTTLPLEGDNGYMTAVRTFRDQLGLELHVTELDIGIAEGHTEEDQGAYYQEFMEALLKEKKDGANITCVTFWGLSDGLSWRPNDNCLLLREDLSRKPAFTGVVNAIGKTEEVIGKIAAIGTIELTDACKEKIEAAREAYDALTEAQKKLVPEESLKALTEAEAEYKKLEEEQGTQNPEKTDQEKADAVKNLIEGIGEVSLASKEKIEAARTAYNALTEAQKKLVPEESLKALTEAEAEYKKLEAEAVNAVKNLIEGIGEVSLASKEKIEAARTAYNALTETQKKLVPEESLKALTEAEAEYKKLEEEAVNAVKNLIEGIGEVSLASKEKIEAARTAYNALTEAQKKLVPEESLKALTEAEAEYKELEAEAVNAVKNLIEGIGTVSLDSKDKIEAARKAYDALTDAQKALVSADILKVLTDAETTYKKLEEEQGSQNPGKADQEKADEVKKLIEGIGTVSLESKEKIEAARAAYNALTDAQKALVSADTLKILTDAEAAYRKLSEEGNKPPVTEKISISKAQISAIPSQVYTGKAIVPSITVSYNGKNLAKGSDYTVSCKNNINIGTASLTVTGTGGYTGTVTKTFTITVKKNKVYTAGNYKYKITSAKTNGTGTVALTGVKSASVKKKLTKLNIASTVKIGGKKFLVTEIGKNACSGCTKATSATIGANVTKIGQKAFYNCKKLKKISIKTKKLKSIGKNAIKGISAKATISCPKKQKARYKKLFKSSVGFKKSMKIK